ncbi:phosphatidate cytidylyltransferase [Winogradskyella sp. A3E31]|uniref:phosphatidate cytidylyltransferase n=1 Tax=Winogradskyella sp. A3E31 TaxID=3349637 RepID=UPI00398B9C0D
MKELTIRAISGALYATLLIASLFWSSALLVLLFIFGFVCLVEYSKLILLKAKTQYVIFAILYFGFWYWCLVNDSLANGSNEGIQILLVTTIFVNLILIKDLFAEKRIPLFESKRYITTTFYLSSGFVFLLLIANYEGTFSPLLLLGAFLLVWVNDSFAYMVGKNFGKQKLFPSISPKKTVEGFLGGLFFACVASYFVAKYTETLTSNDWLLMAIIISVFGTLGDLIESKFKRQASVKDSGVIMPGHGGLLDRLDSIIFAAPFIYLFLRILTYVS